MDLSIITINFKKPRLTISCIESIYGVYKKQFEENKFELIVVDNFSEDNSIEVLQKEIKAKKYKNASVLAHASNNGFGGGNNYGANNAKGKYLLFLNNDTVVKKGFLEMLSFFEKNQKIGILGGPLQNGNGSIQSSAARFYTLPRLLLLLLGLQRFGLDKSPTTAQEVDWVKGALLMIKKDFFEKLHGFDENIFMYTEDMELCYRAKKMGKEVWFFPSVEVVHEDQGSSSRSFAIVHIYSGILYFYKKHKSRFEYMIVKFLLQSKARILVLYGRLKKNDYFVATYEEALNITR